MSNTPKPVYKLQSEDGQLFTAERKPLKYCKFINGKIVENGLNDQNCGKMEPIVVPFHSSIVKLIINWLNHHQNKLPKDPKIRYRNFTAWDRQFFRIESGVLFALLNASHILGIEDLMNMGCAAAAELIRGKSTEEIRKIYGIRSDEEQMEEALANGGEGTSTMTFRVEDD